jgi:dephospho-CoA kinase
MLKLYLTLCKKYRIFEYPMNTAARKSSIPLDSIPFSFHGSPSFILGVTGGIGSGKSLFCRALADSGVGVIEADVLTRTLHADPHIQARIRRTFGEGVFNGDGIDTKRLAEIVFTDSISMTALEDMMLPVLSQKIFVEINRLAKSHKVVAVDMANLYPAGIDQVCDAVVRVRAPLARRKTWLRERGLSERELSDRIRSQRRLSRFNPDWIVDNTGSFEDLVLKAQHILAMIATSVPNSRSIQERMAK